MQSPEERESRMRELAQKLMFTVERTNERYTLIRTADVSRPVKERDLTLTEAEDLLEEEAFTAFKAASPDERARRELWDALEDYPHGWALMKEMCGADRIEDVNPEDRPRLLEALQAAACEWHESIESVGTAALTLIVQARIRDGELSLGDDPMLAELQRRIVVEGQSLTLEP
jgi:hypothetical protein